MIRARLFFLFATFVAALGGCSQGVDDQVAQDLVDMPTISPRGTSSTTTSCGPAYSIKSDCHHGERRSCVDTTYGYMARPDGTQVWTLISSYSYNIDVFAADYEFLCDDGSYGG